MSIRVMASALALALLTQASSADAGIFKGLAEGVGVGIGRGIGEGAVAKLTPVLGQTIANVDNRLIAHEARIGSLIDDAVSHTSGEVGVRLTQVDGILEKRILQVQLSADEVIDHGLDKFDTVARHSIAALDGSLKNRIDQLDERVKDRLAQVDEILSHQVADVSTKVNEIVDHADHVAQERIEQVDEVAGRRLGNVDVIVNQQRLNLERTIIRAAWLIGLVAFVISALKALWNEYVKADGALKATPPGRERAWAYVTVLGKPLLQHVTVAGVVVAFLAVVPQFLPMAAVKDQAALIQTHVAALDHSLATLDFVHVRYHASQLELLDVANAAHYQATTKKAELLRDLLERPTALATPAGVAHVFERINVLERSARGADPDGRTARAMIRWQSAANRGEEHAAASLAASALWSTPRGFTLAPMAKLLIEAYLQAPAPDFDDRPELISADGMRAILQRAKPDATGSPFEGLATLFHLMQELDKESSAAYVAMVEAQSRVDSRQLTPAERAAALAKRNEQAAAVVALWNAFDEAVSETPSVRADALVLNVFRINDVPLSHALWFTINPETHDWPKPLAELSDRQKVALAPARVAWARRYAALLEGPARELILMQEAKRFAAFEQQTLDFERAYAAWQQGPVAEAPKANAKSKPQTKPATAPEPTKTDEELQLTAATAAAQLGIYEGATEKRTPLAQRIAGALASFQQQQSKRSDDLRTQADAELQKLGNKAKSDLEKRVDSVRASLRDSMIGRGPRLM